jgi:hypothetical protein
MKALMGRFSESEATRYADLVRRSQINWWPRLAVYIAIGFAVVAAICLIPLLGDLFQ